MQEDLKICYIHKIAMSEIIEEEPIPFLGIKKFKSYRCPMCSNLQEFEDEEE